MVTLIDKLKYMYPLSDYSLFGVSDDGNGQRISDWMQPFPQPTESEIDKITSDVSGFMSWEFEQKKQLFINSIQNHLDLTAQSRGYYSVDSSTKYIGGKNLEWHNEGLALRDWTIEVWDAAFIILEEIITGERPEPTLEELINELPILSWE